MVKFPNVAPSYFVVGRRRRPTRRDAVARSADRRNAGKQSMSDGRRFKLQGRPRSAAGHSDAGTVRSAGRRAWHAAVTLETAKAKANE